MIEKEYDNKDLQECYEKGYDSIINGANTNNCNYALFTSMDKKEAWEFGRRKALNESDNLEMDLSDIFTNERFKINNEISDERSIAHCHLTINKIEDGVKKFIEKLKEIDLSKCGISGLNSKIDELAGQNFI